MTYSERADAGVRPVQTTTVPLVDYHDTVRWGPIFAGIVVGIVSQLLLSALLASIGGLAAGDASANTIGTGLGIGAIISLLISLFLGGLTMASSCGPMNSKTSMLNAIVMWATTLVLSGFLLTSGVSGVFGVIAANAGPAVTQVEQATGASIPDSQAEVSEAIPNITAQQAEGAAAAAAKGGLAFLIGSLLALAAALVGATVGAKKPRAVVR
ncbi:MAG: hypothetical protein WA947_17660 [Phormidesmis sp.]